MSAQALAVGKATSSNLRPFDIRRDLLAVADLVELCFKKSLDADGRLYIRQMRRTARSGRLLNLAAAAAGAGVDTPPGGFVWIEENDLVANLSLIPVHAQGITRYVIANVAVHPNFRRRGIARALTQAGIQRAEQNHAKEIWLQVDKNNQLAQQLYQSMGFEKQAHRSSWQVKPQAQNSSQDFKQIKIHTLQKADWEQHLGWLEEIYPEKIRWNLPLDLKQFQPGWRGSFQRFLGERKNQQWAASRDAELLAVLTWQSSSLQYDRLWVATSPEGEADALPALLAHAGLHLRLDRNLILNYPAGRGSSIFEQAGFTQLRNLIWMQHVKT